MPPGFERDLEEAKYEDFRMELQASFRKAVNKVRDRRMVKAAQEMEANPNNSWNHIIDLGGGKVRGHLKSLLRFGIWMITLRIARAEGSILLSMD